MKRIFENVLSSKAFSHLLLTSIKWWFPGMHCAGGCVGWQFAFVVLAWWGLYVQTVTGLEAAPGRDLQVKPV